MPTVLTHPVVAIALAPWLRRHGVDPRVIVTGMLCTLVPDLDVIGLRLGIPYDAPLGHRGFSHSLAFATLLAGLLATLGARLWAGVSRPLAFAFFFVCTASHGVLDAMTTGGHGIAFFAPFSNERHFLPWRPIEVSPLSIRSFLSARGFGVLASELRWLVLPAALVSAAGWI
ncbi:MAG TPA: metal-dependent hydrolase, partial [Xanthomonadales bacterium]|nr:metal-dependent hydrolase [Xanthomonadales bacterium]